MRSRKAFINMVSSVSLQLITTVCGILLPRIIISSYGSEINGMIASVTQFLNYIILFESGVSNVVRAALFKPLAENNLLSVSRIIKATDIFFKKISYIFIGYSLLVAAFFPFISGTSNDFLFTFSLVLIIAFSSFMQYFFGLSCQALISADQRRYIYSTILILTTIVNTVTAILLIHFGASIHVVKIATALIFSLRPLLLRLYVKLHYSLDKYAVPDNSALDKKWDGFGHHTAFFLHSNTDIVVLTIASSISSKLSIADISVYSVYNSISVGIRNLVHAVSSGIESAFGNMIAKGETDALKKNFRVYELVSFTITTVMFTCVGLLIVPFVKVYTSGVTDANYIKPVFAVLITLSEAVYCLRIPYNNVTLAAGHYKETRNGAFIEAGINIVLSVILVIPFGLAGVAAATLIAMIFRTVQYAVYLSKNIVRLKVSSFFARILVNSLCSGLSVIIIKAVHILPETMNYFTWFFYALIVFAVTAAITTAVNITVYKNDFKNLLLTVRNIFERKKS